MKRVLIFSLAYFPKHVGGAEVSIKEITDRMPEIEFHMVTNRFDSTLPKEEKIGNVFVHRIGITTANPTMADLKKMPLALNKPTYQFAATWEAHKLHKKYHFDAMWAVMAHSCGVPGALFKMWHPEVKYVLNLQEGDPTDYIERKMRPVWPLFKRAFTSADIVQPLSTFLARWARTMGYTGEIAIIPNAVNAKHFAHVFSEAQLAEARKKIGKKPGDTFLVTTSRLVMKNAVDDVIAAIKFLPETVHFVIYGTGPDETALREQVARLGLRERVHFLGQIGHAEMPLALQACDIFVRPSRSEGFGASFAEAMAAGLPVVATQEGGLADFLHDDIHNPNTPMTGWVVDRDTPWQIADAVRDIMANPEKKERVVATAKKMVFEKYDWDIIATTMREKTFAKLFSTGT